ncbi:MAG: replication-relaxation family protein [Tepidisphaeraceae bacterium]
MPVSPNRDSVRIQDRDVALLRGLFESRALTLSQATAIYFDGKAEPAKKRVQKLKSAGIIRERPRRLYEKSVLFLTTKGFKRITEDGKLSDFPQLSVAAFETRSRLSDLTLRHELDVQEVKTAFASALKSTDFTLKEFSTWPLLSQFRASPGDGSIVEVKPDGFIRIHESDDSGDTFEWAFFLELDRSTETLETLAARARCYLNYYSSGGFAERNGLPRSEYKDCPFRVLMVFKTAERRNNMAVRLLGNRPQILTHSCRRIRPTTLGQSRHRSRSISGVASSIVFHVQRAGICLIWFACLRE